MKLCSLITEILMEWNFMDVPIHRSPESSFAHLPGSPFAGRLYSNLTGASVISNESRVALNRWKAFVTAASKKFGPLPSKWPSKAVQMATELGSKVEQKTGSPQPPAGNNPSNSNPNAPGYQGGIGGSSGLYP
jgi:hypothetical protein